jgi:RND family efflux transporter MFP subunit
MVPTIDVITVSGQIEPEHIATLSAEVADVVIDRPISRGMAVSAGETLLRLDPRASRAALDQAVAAACQATAARLQAEAELRRATVETAAAQQQAQANLVQAAANSQKTGSLTRRQELLQAQAAADQAQSDAALAHLEAERYATLAVEGAAPQEQADTKQTAAADADARLRTALQSLSLAREGARQEDVRASRAAVVSARAGVVSADTRPEQLEALRDQIAALAAQEAEAEAAVHGAQIDLDKHTIRSPFAGLVLDTPIEVGERASAGVPVAQVGATGHVKLTFSVPEAVRTHLRLGQTVRATVDALAGRAFTGRVTVLGSAADANTRSFPVEVRVANPDGALLPNMVARVTLATPDASGSNAVLPASAVATEGGATYVFLIRDGRAVRRDVVLGVPAPGDGVEVESGLRGGETVVAAPQRLVNGARVRPVDTAATAGMTAGEVVRP